LVLVKLAEKKQLHLKKQIYTSGVATGWELEPTLYGKCDVIFFITFTCMGDGRLLDFHTWY